MDLTWSMDEIVRSSDEDAVRRRFARRNRLWLIGLMLFFQFVSLIQIDSAAERKTVLATSIAVANAFFVAFSLFLMYYARENPRGDTLTWRVGGWVRRRVHAVALAFVAIEFSVALFLTRGARADNWMGWAMTFPFLVLGFRMLIAEHLLLHGFITFASVLTAFTAPGRPIPTPAYVGLVVVNVLTVGLELFMSYRMRKEITGEWRARRTQAREQIRMRDELRYARELQMSMLPECAPDADWVDICSVSVPATEVGGDYYDYFVENDQIALVCGDVAGHGMASGLVLSALRSGFTLLSDSLHDPAAVLQRLHDLVARTTRRRMLVTVSVVLLDRAQRTATIASAGHPPVILRRADGTIETITLYAPPLGVRLPVHDIPQRKLAYAPGDIFVLHSDGIYETRNELGEAYGIERLESLIAEKATGTAEELREAILQDVGSFRGTVEPDDDLTVVVCRMT